MKKKGPGVRGRILSSTAMNWHLVTTKMSAEKQVAAQHAWQLQSKSWMQLQQLDTTPVQLK